MQNWFTYSDHQMEDALYDIERIRRFTGVGSEMDTLTDESTILKFRHLLEKHQLTEPILTVIHDGLKEQELLMSQGAMVDATVSCSQFDEE